MVKIFFFQVNGDTVMSIKRNSQIIIRSNNSFTGSDTEPIQIKKISKFPTMQQYLIS